MIKVRNERNGNLRPNSVCYNNDGSLVIAGCEDGSIQCWNTNSKSYYRPNILIKKGHNDVVTCVTAHPIMPHICSRSFDNTMRVWDLRNTKECLKSYENLLNVHDTTMCRYNDDGRLVITGTSVVKGEGGIGKYVIYDVLKSTNEPIYEHVVSKTHSVISVNWQHKLNEIAIGLGDGSIYAYYNPKYSQKGVMLAAAQLVYYLYIFSIMLKKQKHIIQMQMMMLHQILLDYMVVIYRIFNILFRSYMRDYKTYVDPLTKQRPEPQVGKMNVPSSHFTQYYLEVNPKRKNINEDPREALLQQNKKAKQDSEWVDKAYQNTQPVQILADKTLEEEEEEMHKELNKSLRS